METSETNTYIPFNPVHPFEILEEEIEARGMSHKDFARQIGMAPSNFSRMLKNRGELTSEMAMKLEKALAIPYMDWMAYQGAYVKDKERLDYAMRREVIRINLEKLDKDSEIYKSKEYQEIFDAAESASMAEEEMTAYSNSLQKLRDIQSGIEYTRQESYKDGIAKGIAQGVDKTKRQTAIKLLQAGSTPEFIHQITELSLDDINRLSQSL